MFADHQAAFHSSLFTCLCLFFAVESHAAISLDVHPHPSYLAERANGVHAKRDSVSDRLTPGSHSSFYFANVSIGTPPQNVSLKISISVSDTWVWSNNTVCDSSDTACTDSNFYVANSSSTYEYLRSDFDVSYTSDLTAWGDWATETFTIGGKSIDGQQFGIAYNGTAANSVYDLDSSSALLGLGFAAQETQFTGGGAQYPNVPQTLVNAYLINSNAYSLWLNDLQSSTGSLLFGAVDEEKFEGDLMTIPIVATREAASSMILSLTDLKFGESQPLKRGNVPVTLTLGSTLSYLPSNVTAALYTAVGATYDNGSNTAAIDCGQSTNAVTLDFTFSWAPISIPMSELVLSNGTENDCIFAISIDDTQPTLGLGFLRSTYVVCDLSNQEISIAPTKFNADKSHIVDIENGINGVPGAVRTLTATSTSHTSTATNSPTPASSSAAPHPPSKLSSGASAGIGVGVALAVIALSAATYFLWRWRKRRIANAQGQDYRYGEVKQELPADSVARPENVYDAKRVSELVPSPGLLLEPVEVAGSEPQRHELG